MGARGHPRRSTAAAATITTAWEPVGLGPASADTLCSWIRSGGDPTTGPNPLLHRVAQCDNRASPSPADVGFTPETFAGLLADVVAAGHDLEAPDLDGCTIMHRLAVGDDPIWTSVALRAGCRPGTPNRTGWTPLHAAAITAHADTLRLLIDGGGDPMAMDGSGRTPVLLAAAEGCAAIVRLLVEAGAGHPPPGVERSPLTAALGSGSAETVGILVAAGHQPDQAALDICRVSPDLGRIIAAAPVDHAAWAAAADGRNLPTIMEMHRRMRSSSPSMTAAHRIAMARTGARWSKPRDPEAVDRIAAACAAHAHEPWSMRLLAAIGASA